MNNKNIFFAIMIMFFAIFLNSCQKDDQDVSNATGEITLSFSEITENLKSASTVVPYAIVATIIDESGNTICDEVEMELYSFGSEYVTQALTLDPGDYQLTEYYVIDSDNNVIYATPQEGSTYASWVEDPLPIDFSVSKDEVTALAPEVVSTENSDPEDFGYTTFRLNVVESFDFLMAVFAYDETQLSYELTSATVTVTADSIELVSEDVDALTDTISVPDTYDSYVIKVEKDGYTTYYDTISNSELQKYYSSDDYGPMKVYLSEEEEEDAITLVTDQSTLADVTIGLRAEGEANATYVINWGDEEYTNVSDVENATYESHTYSNEGVYTIQIMGDIDVLTWLVGGVNSQITDADISLGKNLENVIFSQNNLTSLDVSNNTNLISLNVNRNYSITDLDLTNNVNLTNLYVSDNELSNLDVSMLTQLKTLWCSSNNLSTLNVSNNTNLTSFICGSNNLTSIDVSNNISLNQLYVTDMSTITSLDISKNTELSSLAISKTNISDLDISNNTQLSYINLACEGFSEEAINSFIIQLYDNVSSNNVIDGHLYNYEIDPTDSVAIADLQDLQDTYNWTITQ